jgi:hypothetical protein
VQEYILHIKLMNWPRVRNSQGEHDLDCGWLDHRAKGLTIVDAGSLGEAAKDPQALYRSKEPSELNLCLKIHLPVTTLEPTGRGTRSRVLLVIKATNSSSMVWRKFGSMRAAQTEEGTNDKVDAKVADKVSLSVGSRKARFVRMVIR